MRFMARAAEEGFRVSKPWGDSARYDFAVEENGRFLRIQVKSTIFRSGSGYACSIQRAGEGGAQRYTTEQVDFFAAYVIPEDVWYILPTEVAGAVNGQLQLSPKKAKQRYANYKEAWHLLHAAVAKNQRKLRLRRRWERRWRRPIGTLKRERRPSCAGRWSPWRG